MPDDPKDASPESHAGVTAPASQGAAQIVSVEGLAEAAPDDDSAAITELRERAATALENALGFVSDYADPLAVLRAHVMLEAAPPAECVELLAGHQRADGAFEPIGFVFSGATMNELRDASVPADLVGTLEGLSVLADLRALSSGCAERAIEFLTRVQRTDGSFGNSDPGSERGLTAEAALEVAVADRLFSTGMLGGFAARTPYVRPEVLAWAARFLAKAWSPERVEGGRLSAIAAFAHFYANGGDQDLADEALQWCGRELERGFRTHRFEANETLRVMRYCDAHALPGATFDAVELLVRLLEEQAGDGGFAALDPGGPPGRVAPTLDAILAIRALCNSL